MARFDANGHFVADSDRPPAQPPPPPFSPLSRQPQHTSPSSHRPSSAVPQPSLSSFLSPTSSSCPSTCPPSFSAWLSPPSSLLSSLIRNPHEAALLHSLASDASTLDSLLRSLSATVVQGERLHHATLHLPHLCHPSGRASGVSIGQGEGAGSVESASDASSSSSSSSSSSPSSPPQPILPPRPLHSAAAPPPPPPAPATTAAVPIPPSTCPAPPSGLFPFSTCDYEGVHRPSFFADLRAAFSSQVSSMSTAFQRLTSVLLSLHERLSSLSSFHHLNERMAEELHLEGCTAIAEAKRTVAAVEQALITRLTHLLAASLTPEEEEQGRDERDEKEEAEVMLAGEAVASSTAMGSGAAPPSSPVVSSSASASTSSTSSSSLSPSAHLDVILGVRSGGAGLTGKKRRGSVEETDMKGGMRAEVDAAQHQLTDEAPVDDGSTQGRTKRRRGEPQESDSEERAEVDAARASVTVPSPLHPPSPSMVVPSSPLPLPGMNLDPLPLLQSSRVLFSTDDGPALAIRQGQEPVDPPSAPSRALTGGVADEMRQCEDIMGSSESSSPSSSPPLFPASSSSSPPPSPLPLLSHSSTARVSFLSQPSPAPAPSSMAAAVRRSRSLGLSMGDDVGRGAPTASDVAFMAAASAMAAVAVGGGEREVEGSMMDGGGGDVRRGEVKEEGETMAVDGMEAAALLVVRCSQESGAAERSSRGGSPDDRPPVVM